MADSQQIDLALDALKSDERPRIYWYKGPPPAIGWWPASQGSDIHSIRYWDGEFWGWYVKDTESIPPSTAWTHQAPNQAAIRWTLRTNHQNWPMEKP